MSIESWKDLGTPERINDAITDMEQCRGWVGEIQTRILERIKLHSEASNVLWDVLSGLSGESGDLRGHIYEAEQAKAHLPDYDATDAEKARHARGRG